MIDRTEKDIMKEWETDITEPLVSICTLTYNHEKFIEEALDSFLIQRTRFPFEIVINDDYSLDSTAEIIKKYVEKFPIIMNVKLRKKNVGAKLNSIDNIQRAKGDYIAFCEGDDYWRDPFKLQKQVDFLESNSDFSISFHAAVYVNDKSEITSTNYIYRDDYSQDELICGVATMPTCAKMIRKLPYDLSEYLQKSYIGDTIVAHYAGFIGKAKFQDNIKSAAYRIHSEGVWSGLEYIKRVQTSIATRRLLKENLYGDLRRIGMIEDSIVNTYLEYLFLFLRSNNLKNYRELLFIIWKDKDTNTGKVALLHIFDIPKRIINKLIKFIKSKK